MAIRSVSSLVKHLRSEPGVEVQSDADTPTAVSKLRSALGTGALLLFLCVPASADRTSVDRVISTEKLDIRIERVTKGLEHPWGLAFLPDGRLLVTERPGRLRIIDPNGALSPRPVEGLPAISAHGQGGLLDIALHPDFRDNRLLYLSYVASGEGGIGTEVVRGRWNGQDIDDIEVIFSQRPKSRGGRHFGSRLIFDNRGRLNITLGDRGDRARAQRLDDHAGSVIRLNDDGSIPEDNPFTQQKGGLSEIFSYGHRNIQGAALHPVSGELWTHEHGPQGGDELNVIRPGVNYGWPLITYGVNYGIGTPIGEGTHKPGMAQPLYYWDPSIAPSGMSFYTGDRFPQWRNNILLGSLKFGLLVRLELDAERVTHEERMLDGELGRIRDVRQGPDGLIFLLTDSSNGALYRLSPVPD